MKRFITKIALIVPLLLLVTVSAPSISYASGCGYSDSSICINALPHSQTNTSTSEIHTILSIFFGIVGALSVLFITISGVRYIFANGDSQKTANAREGIIYALVGLAVAISAEAIVAFVVGRVG